MRLRKQHLVWGVISVVVAIAAGEVFARYYLGLGTPPLSVAHSKIEYMFKPNQDVYRFGNHIIINAYGMRTKPFAVNKGDGEFRMMIFGDSVLNGGNQTDHADLTTTIVQERLSEAARRNVVVGNITAPSWGPGNWLAYAKEYGFFGADIVAVVISSHDYADNPAFEVLNKNLATQKPVSALLEGITRYLPRYLPSLGASAGNEPDRFEDENHALKGLQDLRSFLALAKNNSTNVMVLQHWEKSEIERGFAKPGNQRIKQVCESLEISPISLEPYFGRSMENGENPYRDNIHPNQVGQQLIAMAFLKSMPDNSLQRTR